MAFGQRSGPPATSRQIKELLDLLQAAGHSDFRDARGPMGFTQRQGAGKFTREEATTFIDRLEGAGDEGASLAENPSPMASAAEQMLRRMPADQLGAELRRRGWTVTGP